MAKDKTFVEPYVSEEQESHISYDVKDKMWIFETNYIPHIRKLLALHLDQDESAVLEFDKVLYKTKKELKILYIKVKIDPEVYNLKPFPKKKRELTEEQKQRLVNQFKKWDNDLMTNIKKISLAVILTVATISTAVYYGIQSTSLTNKNSTVTQVKYNHDWDHTKDISK